MLKENMYLGMKVARRKCGSHGLEYKYTEVDRNAKFDNNPCYIVRWLERPHNELNRVSDPKIYCVTNQSDLTKNDDDYREGVYSHADMLEPYDLAMEKQNGKNTKGGN